MISTLDVAWAAGFLEGEGSFIHNKKPLVTATQVQREPLERLVRIFGGKILPYERIGRPPILTWALPAQRSAQVMMTLYCLMSPRRKQQIDNAIAKWKTQRIIKNRHSDICINGHVVTGGNRVRCGVDGKYYTCRICKNAGQREWAKRVRSVEQIS